MKFLYLIPTLLLLLSSCNDTSSSSQETPANANALTPKPFLEFSMQCYLLVQGRDTTWVQLSVSGDNVIGMMHWKPFEKDGAIGALHGKRTLSGEFDLIYDYTIEGHRQSETKMMKIEDDALWIKQGPLEDPVNDGHLRYTDVNTATYSQQMMRVDCNH